MTIIQRLNPKETELISTTNKNDTSRIPWTGTRNIHHQDEGPKCNFEKYVLRFLWKVAMVSDDCKLVGSYFFSRENPTVMEFLEDGGEARDRKKWRKLTSGLMHQLE